MICRFRLHFRVITALGIGLLASAFATEAAGLVVDHHSVALFDQIPPEYLARGIGTAVATEVQRADARLLPIQ